MTLLLCQVMADFANYDSSSDNGDDDFGVWGGGFPEGAVAKRRRRRDVFRCFGPCFPWFTGGGTTQEVLDNAGIVVFSDAYIHNIDSKFVNQSTDFTSAAWPPSCFLTSLLPKIHGKYGGRSIMLMSIL